MTPEKLLEKAVVSLLQSEPFWAALVLRLKRVPADSSVCDIMATDGKLLYYNPEAIGQFTFDQLKTILAHEAAHCALLHVARSAGKRPKVANMAADYVTNAILAAGGYAEIPGWLLDPRFDGMEFEKVYAILNQEVPEDDSGSNGGGQQQAGGQQQCQSSQAASSGQSSGQSAPSTPGGFGQILQPANAQQAESLEQEWKVAVEQAAAVAKAAGHLPAGLRRLVEDVRRARLDYRAMLRQFIAACVPQDFTWSKPNRRTLSQGIYLPGVKKEGTGVIAVSIDTSGSISADQLASFAAELRAIHADMKPERLVVIYHDAEVAKVDEFGPDDDLVIEPVGGGGTDFRPTFEYVASMEQPPRCVIMLTDMEGMMPAAPPDVPVLWISVSPTRRTAPFGEVVVME
jgi:predicted metal-dependent peptidase